MHQQQQAMGPGEYFGGQPAVSLGYCRGGRKMLVFCILTDPSGVTQFNEQIPGGVAVIHKPEHQLPLAVVTFDPYKLAEAPARLGKKKKAAAKAARAVMTAARPMPAPSLQVRRVDAAARAAAAQGIRPIPMRRVDLDGKEVAAAKAPMPPPDQHPEEYARWRKRRRDEVDARRDEDDEDLSAAEDVELQRALKLSMRRQVDERKEDDEMRRAIALSMRVY